MKIVEICNVSKISKVFPFSLLEPTTTPFALAKGVSR